MANEDLKNYADNSPLTARVKELEADRDSWRRVAEKLAGEKQAFETQLAVARKALEDIAHPKALTSLSRDKARAALDKLK